MRFADLQILQIESIWIVLCGVTRRSGECPTPHYVAAVASDGVEPVQTGVPKLLHLRSQPYPSGRYALIVTFEACDLVHLHLALGWQIPDRIIDLRVEFRNRVNGLVLPCGAGLTGALAWYGIPLSPSVRSQASPQAVLDRLNALVQLFFAMLPDIDVARAVLRGRALVATAKIEATGIPADAEIIRRLAESWPQFRSEITAELDRPFGAYRCGRFDLAAFEAFLRSQNIAWPRLGNGRIDLSDETFRERARAYPELKPLKELRTTLTAFDPRALAVGRDNRSRVPLCPFGSRTGRNEPSTKASLLGTAAWVRHLIKPAACTSLALIDWAQQEFGIAAALSEDPEMQKAYVSGDPYLAFAQFGAAAPRSGAPVAEAMRREQFKACALGVQYGMGAATLAAQLRISEGAALGMISKHKAAFPRFWRWCDGVEVSALLRGRLQTVFGWQILTGPRTNPCSLRNYPVQANAAEMLRLAACLITETGIRVCAPLHDAFLIEARTSEIADAVLTVQRLTAEASEVVLGGFALRSEVTFFRHPDRYHDSRGEAVWSAVKTVLRANRPVRRRDAA